MQADCPSPFRRLHTVAWVVLVLVTLLPPPARAAQAAPDATEMAGRARKLTTTGQLDEAVSLFNNALKVDPELFEAHIGLGIALDLQGQYAQGREHLERALQRATESARPLALSTLAIAHVFQGGTAEAAKYYQQLFDLQVAGNTLDGAASTANALGRLYLESGKTDLAEQWYRTGSETARKLSGLPVDQLDLWEMRWVHAQSRIAARRGDAATASKHAAALKVLIDKGGENAKQLPIYHYLVGYNALYLGQPAAALAALREADLTDPFILGLLAEAAAKQGDSAAAKGYWTKALAVNGHSLQNALTREKAKSGARN